MFAVVFEESGLGAEKKPLSSSCNGRRLTRRIQMKILAALNTAADKEYSLTDLFNYPGS